MNSERLSNFSETNTVNLQMVEILSERNNDARNVYSTFRSAFIRSIRNLSTYTGNSTVQPIIRNCKTTTKFRFNSRRKFPAKFTFLFRGFIHGPRPNSMNAKSRGRIANPRPTYSLSGEFTQSRQKRPRHGPTTETIATTIERERDRG